MHESHEQARYDTPCKGGEHIQPQVPLIYFSIEAQRIHVAYLVGSLGQAEGRIETAPRDGPCELDHGEESDGDGGRLEHAVLGVLSPCENLAEDA